MKEQHHLCVFDYYFFLDYLAFIGMEIWNIEVYIIVWIRKTEPRLTLLDVYLFIYSCGFHAQ